MPFYRKLALAIVTGALTCAVGRTARAEDYKVVLSRPEAVGQMYTIHATGELSQTTTIDFGGGQPPQKRSDAFKAELQGTIKVLAIDDHTKQSTKIQCTVEKLTRDGQPILDPGTVVTAENTTGQTAFTVNGNPVERSVAPVLDLLLSVHKAGSPSDDLIFGTDKAQPVGGTWPINAAAAAADTARDGLPVTQENFHGEAKLVGVKEVGGKQALDIAADMSAENFSGPMPNGGTIEKGNMKAHLTGLFPSDPSQQPLEQVMVYDVQMKGSAPGPGGKPVAIELSISRSTTAEFSEPK